MNLFGIQFLTCNIYITFFVFVLILLKKIFKKYLSERTQYNLWFILLIILIFPFLQLPIKDNILFYHSFSANVINQIESFQNTLTNQNRVVNYIKDFTVSINHQSLNSVNNWLVFIWLIGIIIMLMISLKSFYRLYCIKKSALPLQNQEIIKIYRSCLSEMNINKNVPVYSTVFLKSPILVGIIKPCIYIPTHLISSFNKQDIRYMLLHELNHYVYKDAIINFLMNIFRNIYWFNIFIWYAFNEMKNDREIACDIETLKMLNEKEHIEYGYTLIHFAEKVSLSPFPYINKIGGSAKQIKKRIIHIVNYKNKKRKTLSNLIIVFLTIGVSLYFVPLLSIHANNKENDFYSMDNMNIAYFDCSKQFGEYDGSFVLFDEAHNTWKVFNEEFASLRVAPDSTYKIYDALFALEEGIISSKYSNIKWNKEKYPFPEWEKNHDLNSAMAYSVNWYFQTIDAKLGFRKIHSFLKNIDYGNQTTSHNIETYWSDSSLKISPVEQVKLLQKFHQNTFSFSNENIQTVKNALLLSSNKKYSLFGKTGTGRINGNDINGWFIGFIETDNNTYYFATNIQARSHASGSQAAEMTLSILNKLGIYEF